MEEKILEIHENKKDYGYRRMCGELRNQGFIPEDHNRYNGIQVLRSRL